MILQLCGLSGSKGVTAFFTYYGSVGKVGRVVRSDYQYYNPSAKIYLEGIVLGGVP
jgi:hypothetical protein